MNEHEQSHKSPNRDSKKKDASTSPPPASPDGVLSSDDGAETLAGAPPPVPPDLSRLSNLPDVATHTVKMGALRNVIGSALKAAPKKARPVAPAIVENGGAVPKLRLAGGKTEPGKTKSRLRLVKPPPGQELAPPGQAPPMDTPGTSASQTPILQDSASAQPDGSPAVNVVTTSPASMPPVSVTGCPPAIESSRLFGPDKPWRTFSPDFIAAISSLTPGTQIGEYKIWSPIGRSPFGATFRGRQTETNEEYVIKFIDIPPADDIQGRFEQVGTQLGSLQHPVACPCLGFYYDPPFAYLVNRILTMPKGLAPNLHDYRARFAGDDGFMSERQVLKVGYQMVTCLVQAHSIGLLHGGLKPNNLLFEYIEGDDQCWRLQLQITDFGIATILGPDYFQSWLQQVLEAEEEHDPSTLEGVMFLAPEQWDGAPGSAASDIYAAAAVIHHFLTGHDGLERRMLPSAYRDGLHPGWDPILGKALRTDPNRRYPSAGEFAECLDAIDLPPPDAEDIAPDDTPPEKFM